jgi:hypothetical protein
MQVWFFGHQVAENSGRSVACFAIPCGAHPRILAATRAADRARRPTGTAVKQKRAHLIGVILAEEAKSGKR